MQALPSGSDKRVQRVILLKIQATASFKLIPCPETHARLRGKSRFEREKFWLPSYLVRDQP